MRTLLNLSMWTMICLNAVSVHATTLVNPGFETAEPTGGAFPNSFGDWTGDISQIVTAQDGITPAGGTRMLHFLDASTVGPTITRTSSNVQQLVDMSALAAEIAAGTVVVETSVLFNRVVGDTETDTQFGITIDAMDGVPADYGAKKGASAELAISDDLIITDSDVETWESSSTSLLLPPTTTYIAVRISAFENIVNDAVAPEFDGHYADNVVLTYRLVPEPSTTLLMLSALIAKMVVLSRLGRGVEPHPC